MAVFEIMENGNIVNRCSLPVVETMSQVFYLVSAKESGLVRLLEETIPDVLVAMMQVNGLWVLLEYNSKISLTVNHVPLIGLKILDHGDEIQSTDVHLRFVAEAIEVLKSDSALITERKVCMYCQDKFKIGDRIILCPECGLPHHIACWMDFGRCASRPFCGHVIRNEKTGQGVGSD